VIPQRPSIPAAIPPTTAPVEMFAPELETFPPAPVEEGLDVREVSPGRVNEVVKTDDFWLVLREVLIHSSLAQANEEADRWNKP
jgi:hypothetical protein